MGKQNDSDPLPFVQVDRSAEPKVALLASELKVTTQHALGSLVQWWRLNAEPRALEAIIAETAPGAEPAVLIDQETARLRFRLASGHDVGTPVLVELGLVALTGGDKVRVRGMSRYLGPIAGRERLRAAASKGGKATQALLRSARGVVEAPVQGSVEHVLEAPLQGSINTEIRDQRSEVIDQTSDRIAGPPSTKAKKRGVRAQATLPGVPEAPTTKRKLSWQETLYERFVADRALELCERGLADDLEAREPDPPPPQFVNSVLEQRIGALPADERGPAWGDLLTAYWGNANAEAKGFPFRYLVHAEVFQKTARAAVAQVRAEHDGDESALADLLNSSGAPQ